MHENQFVHPSYKGSGIIVWSMGIGVGAFIASLVTGILSCSDFSYFKFCMIGVLVLIVSVMVYRAGLKINDRSNLPQ